MPLGHGPHPPCRLLVVCGAALILLSQAVWGDSLWQDLRYAITLRISPSAGTYVGSEEITFTNASGERLEELFLRLYPNGSSLYGAGELRADALSVDGRSVDSEVIGDGTFLWISLSEPLEANAKVVLRASFSGRLAQWGASPGSSPVGYGTFAASPRTMTLTSFYPILAVLSEDGWDLDPVGSVGDPVTSQAASFAVDVTVPREFSVVTSGVPVPQMEGTESVTRAFTGEGLRDFAIVVAATSLEVSATEAGLRVAFSPDHAEAAQTTLSIARAALDLFADAFGPFPFPQLSLVEVPLSRAAGVEFPGLILIDEAYGARPRDLFFEIIIAHEVAHQWWYAAVGNDVVEEPWLDEGLAMFSTYLYLEQARGRALASQVLASWEDAYLAARQAHPDLTVGSPAYLFPDSETYSAFVYDGGAILFQDLRERIGEEAFSGALRAYFQDEAGRIAGREDLLGHLEAACGCSVDGIVSEHLRPR